jgi:pyroglutamyl-peptidase
MPFCRHPWNKPKKRVTNGMAKAILVTGFDPFGGEHINPSWEVVQRLPDHIGKSTLIKAQLPTSFKRGPARLIALAKKHQPDTIVSLGQAGGRSAITPERIAINLKHSERLADNDGVTPDERAVVRGGVDGRLATLPNNRMVAAIRAMGLPAEVSNSAGLFVCNCVLYYALQWAEQNNARAGFIHIPYLPEQVKDKSQPSLPLEEMVRAIEAALAVV